MLLLILVLFLKYTPQLLGFRLPLEHVLVLKFTLVEKLAVFYSKQDTKQKAYQKIHLGELEQYSLILTGTV